MTTPRIEPLEPPYPKEIQERFDGIMPDGVAPLTLFRTLARSVRIYERIHAGGLLDRGSISLRQREIVIDRTCARLGAEYEWGVHVAFFASKVGLDSGQQAAIVHGDAEADCWSGKERLLIRLVDCLVDTAAIDDTLWRELADAFSDEQLIELITLTGFYHTISFLVRGLRLSLEDFAARFPDAALSRGGE